MLRIAEHGSQAPQIVHPSVQHACGLLTAPTLLHVLSAHAHNYNSGKGCLWIV